MNPVLKAQIIRYLLAMNASAFDSAIHAVVAFFGVAGAHAVVDTIPALTLQQGAAVFLIAFGRALLAYLDAHPVSIPNLIPAEPQLRPTAETTTNQPKKENEV